MWRSIASYPSPRSMSARLRAISARKRSSAHCAGPADTCAVNWPVGSSCALSPIYASVSTPHRIELHASRLCWSSCASKAKGGRGSRVRSEFQKAGELIRAAQEIALISHERPDGDAVGSLLALTVSLQLDGKRVTPVLADGVPGRFRFLPAAQAVQTRLPDSWDLLICVDSGDLERLGFEPSAFGTPPDLNIDHHPTNTNFARVNIVDPVAAATAEILYDLILSLEMPLDVDVASNLLAGIVNDTIGFRTTNVTPKVLRTAADLLGRGAPLAHIYEPSLSQRRFVAARYLGSGLSNLERDGGLVWASLSLQDRQRAVYPPPHHPDLL